MFDSVQVVSASQNEIQILVTIIAGIVSLAVGLTSFGIGWLNHRRQKKEIFINTITNNRVVWAKEMRSIISDYITLTRMGVGAEILEDKNRAIEYFNQLSLLKNQLQLHVNYRGYIDNLIMSVFNEIHDLVEIIYETYTIYSLKTDEEIVGYITFSINSGETRIFNGIDYDLDRLKINSNITQEELISESKMLLSELKRVRKNESLSSISRIVKNIELKHNELTMLVQIYCKLEWERVKLESNGKFKKSKEHEQKSEVDKLIEEYKLDLNNYRLNKSVDYFEYTEYNIS